MGSTKLARKIFRPTPIKSIFRYTAVALAALTVLPLAAEACAEHRKWAVALRVDNDLFGGRGQDQGYSNGLQITAISRNIANLRDDPCLSTAAQHLNTYLDWLQPGAYSQRNMVVSLQHALYTPRDRSQVNVIPNDRPYAAALLFSVGYNAREDNHLRISHLRLGMVGPVAFGQEMQDAWHDLIGVKRFHGWDEQLHNEPVFQLVHERLNKYVLGTPSTNIAGLGQDLIVHWGAALGNLGTHANTGLEWRLGWKLPDDFGSAPLRPAGSNAAPRPGGALDDNWSGHLFVNLDSRWVLRDITLDGNTFRNSHRVDKKNFVTDLGFGMAFTQGDWKLAFAHYFRSREFDGQRDRPVYGSVTIGRRF